MRRIGLYGHIMQKIKVVPDFMGGRDFAVFSLEGNIGATPPSAAAYIAKKKGCNGQDHMP